MAYIEIKEITTLGATKHTATSFEFHYNEECTDLIEGAYNITDVDKLLKYSSPLIDPVTKKMYDGSYPIFGKVRVKFGDRWEDDWFLTGPCLGVANDTN